ncbi:MAG: dihydrofolate reductase family protein [Bacteroidia bacterium]|jgi:dihydrofolate reductase
MSKVFFDIAVSLDGFVAGDHRGPHNTIGDGGMALHQWMFVQKAFWEHLGVDDGQEDGPDGKIIRDVIARTGTCIMGKRMFEEGEPNWPENLFKSDVYVLTHEKRSPWIQKGNTTFYFINDGIASALGKARESAGRKDIRIMGGAETIQQFLNAGVVDECILHLTPVLLGSGKRLFDKIHMDQFEFAISGVTQSARTTHLFYTIRNK